MISLANSAARRSLRTVSQVRTLSSGIDIDVDHYSSGWNIDDIGEFTAKTGKYQIKTFNKISEKVRYSLQT